MAIVLDPEEHELRALAAVVPSFAALRVVEIGCGSGRLTRRYASGTRSVIAIDPDAASVAALKAELPGVDARAMSVDSLTLPPQSADVVLFAWSL